MEYLYLTIFFIFGSILGSFYHVIATRLTKGESIVSPKSHCEKCNHQLSWYELIPIISYLLLGGKCRSCKTKLPLSYLLMELCTGILFAVCYHVFGLTLELIVALIFVSSLIIIIISDIEYMIILDEVIASSCIIIIILYLSLFGLEFTVNKILSAILAFITMYVIKLIGDHLFKRESMGGGDIKLMFLFGLVIGYPLSICNIFLATFIAFPIAIYLLLSRKDNLIPFGPFLAMAAILIHISKIDINSIINFIIK